MYEMRGIHDQARTEEFYERWEERNGQPHADLDEERERPRHWWRFLHPDPADVPRIDPTSGEEIIGICEFCDQPATRRVSVAWWQGDDRFLVCEDHRPKSTRKKMVLNPEFLAVTDYRRPGSVRCGGCKRGMRHCRCQGLYEFQILGSDGVWR